MLLVEQIFIDIYIYRFWRLKYKLRRAQDAGNVIMRLDELSFQRRVEWRTTTGSLDA